MCSYFSNDPLQMLDPLRYPFQYIRFLMKANDGCRIRRGCCGIVVPSIITTASFLLSCRRSIFFYGIFHSYFVLARGDYYQTVDAMVSGLIYRLALTYLRC